MLGRVGVVQTRRRSRQLQQSVHVLKLLILSSEVDPEVHDARWENNPQFLRVSAETQIENTDECLASAAGCAATWQSFASFAACGQLVAPVSPSLLCC